MFCKNCGNELKDGVKFCGNCGNCANADSSVRVSPPKPQKNGIMEWLSDIDEDNIEKVCDVISAVMAVIILLMCHSTIGLLWSLTSNKLVFFLHMIFFLGKFSFLEIPAGIIKLVYSVASKKGTFKVVHNVIYIILCPITSVISLLIFGNKTLEIVFLIIAAIYGIIDYCLCKKFE